MKKIISLGQNCEVSFQIQRYVNKFESSLFSWAFILDEEKFLEALQNVQDILKNEIGFEFVTNDMFMDKRYNISFHGRTGKTELFAVNGGIKDSVLYEKTLEELKSRIEYLKSKFIKDFSSDVEKIYIKKLEIKSDLLSWEEGTIDYIKRLYNFFDENVKGGNFKIIVVIENDKYSPLFDKLQNEKLFIRTLAFFSPVDNTKEGGDNYGWKKIFDEFCSEDIDKDVRISEEEINNRMLYLQEKSRQKAYENLKLRVLLEEERGWQNELFEAKKWLEGQYMNLIK